MQQLSASLELHKYWNISNLLKHKVIKHEYL